MNAAVVTNFVDGKPIQSLSDRLFEKYSPYTGKHVTSFPLGSEADVNQAVASARKAFDDGRWSDAKPSMRKALMHRFADLVHQNAAQLDILDAQDMGKPVSIAFCNSAAGAGYMHFNAEAFDKINGSVLHSDVPSLMLQRRVPHGVVAGFASWNFPMYVALLKFMPALAAGNTVVLKPSEFSPSSALLLAELAIEAGIPPGVLNVVQGAGPTVGRALGLHMGVDMVTFTGSTRVGKLIMEYAAQSNMKKVMLECGGKSPQIVFDDGLNLDDVAQAIAGSILNNQGQVCSAGTRLVVQKSLEAELNKKIIERFKAIRMGDPVDPQTTFGPIASKQQLAGVEKHIAGALEDGAELVCGGKRALPDTGGNFIEPALFRGVKTTTRIAREEIFGPVLSVLSFDTEDEAVRIANSTDFGLTSTVWSTRLATALRVAKRIRSSVVVRTGAVASEGAGYTGSNEPAAQSGIGVEGGMPGIESYLRRQSISVFHG